MIWEVDESVNNKREMLTHNSFYFFNFVILIAEVQINILNMFTCVFAVWTLSKVKSGQHYIYKYYIHQMLLFQVEMAFRLAILTS